MELLAPGFGLLLFQLTTLFSIVLFISSWVTILITNRLESNQKLVWLLGTLFPPVIGPILFFISFNSMSRKVKD